MQTRSLAATTLALGGVPIDGFADGDVIKITPDADTFVSVIGADGTKQRAHTGCESFKVEVTLLAGSRGNSVLTGFRIADEESAKAGKGGVLLPFVWKAAGLDLFVADEAWIVAPAEVTESNGVPTRTWKLETGKGKLFLGT